jgi:pyrroline-5-carboxylate reductase
MLETRLAVVGGGQMGRALVGGMIAGGVLRPERIHVVDPNPECRGWWQANQPAVEVSDRLAAAVGDASAVLLAVKPNLIESVVSERSDLWTGKLLISVAAGVTLPRLCGWIGHRCVTRVMPNTPALVGAGASAFCCGEDVTASQRDEIEAMLGAVGVAVEVTEAQMDAVTGLSGSGPAYVFVAIESLADGGVLAGLPRPLALALATQTVLGAAKMVAETARHPAELKDAVASPGGTTIAGLRSLEHNGFRAALIEAVAASASRSRELG